MSDTDTAEHLNNSSNALSPTPPPNLLLKILPNSGPPLSNALWASIPGQGGKQPDPQVKVTAQGKGSPGAGTAKDPLPTLHHTSGTVRVTQ